ncbi:MAG: substrate-binding domain-containing protein [Phycisphaeraceae bacterium]|nr:MAG: substrate-binding domain-containing protein [Phycisphaeraceae bacterium]
MAPHRSDTPRLVLWLIVLLLVVLTGATLWRTGAFAPPPTIALVASAESPYWNDAILGAQDAAKHYDAVVDVYQAKGGEPEQTKILYELAAKGVSGIAVSPLHAVRQSPVLREIGRKIPVVTFDSDSPNSGRMCFVGTDNYTAGRQCAELVREALPDGGTVVIAIGSLDKENGRLRRQGVIDELLERSFGPGRPPEPMGQPLAGPRYTIVKTLVDNNDAPQAKQNIVDLLASGETPNCIVGLYAYNGPAAVEALTEAGKIDGVVVIGFDYTDETLEAIENGQIYASMAQDPYNYGYHAVRILAEEARGRGEANLPMNEILDIRCFPIKKDNLEQFKAKLAKQRSGDGAG